MAVYAIGDVQGCFDELLKLLTVIQFDHQKDCVWLVGDLVNRGPNSAEVLRFAKRHHSSVKVVLGNHDLHLLANAAGADKYRHHKDTMMSVLTADDRDELITWLRHQPLFYHDEQLAFSMVHAGVPPQWSIETCQKRAREVESILQSDDWLEFAHYMYGNQPSRWCDTLTGWDRLRYVINCFTRLRYCRKDGQLALKFKGNPADSAPDELPWFTMPNRKTMRDNIVFGHWSTLGTGQYGHVFSLDGGAVWGGELVALRIDAFPYKWWAITADRIGAL